jgi:hypothetical protein
MAAARLALLAAALVLAGAASPAAAAPPAVGRCAPARASDAAEYCRLNGPGNHCDPCDAAAFIVCPEDDMTASPRIERCAAGARTGGAGGVRAAAAAARPTGAAPATIERRPVAWAPEAVAP